MQFRQVGKLSLCCAMLLVLILDPKTALIGANAGIELCRMTLIPSLFPFFVLSGILTGALTGNSLPLLRPLGKLCGIPIGAESLLAVGFLGGYPVGAVSIGQAYRQGQLSRADAIRMLGFCSNAGPAFIFGILGSMFSHPATGFLLWIIHMLSALLVGIVTVQAPSSQSAFSAKTVTFSDSVSSSVKTMATVCGWVILFRILMEFLERWFLWLLPNAAKVLVYGLLELGGGCLSLRSVETEGLRFLLASLLLAFGGGCVAMQTASVSQLPLVTYYRGKILQAAFSAVFSLSLQGIFPEPSRFQSGSLLYVCCAAVLFAAIAIRKCEKRSSIPGISGV